MEDELTERLIESVRQHEIIWDTNHPRYKLVKKKARAWKAVSEECDIPIDLAKRKWKGLRDSYCRELNKLITPDIAAPIWRFTESLEFLREVVKPRISSSEDIKYPQTISPIPIPESCESSNDVFETLYSFPEAAEVSNNYKQEYQPPPKKKKTDVETNLINTMQSITNYLAKPRKVERTKYPSTLNIEDELFCRSLVEKISKFPLEQKNEAKLSIMQHLCQMEVDIENSKLNILS